jgi:hypothetical protein
MPGRYRLLKFLQHTLWRYWRYFSPCQSEVRYSLTEKWASCISVITFLSWSSYRLATATKLEQHRKISSETGIRCFGSNRGVLWTSTMITLTASLSRNGLSEEVKDCRSRHVYGLYSWGILRRIREYVSSSVFGRARRAYIIQSLSANSQLEARSHVIA